MGIQGDQAFVKSGVMQAGKTQAVTGVETLVRLLAPRHYMAGNQ